MNSAGGGGIGGEEFFCRGEKNIIDFQLKFIIYFFWGIPKENISGPGEVFFSPGGETFFSGG